VRITCREEIRQRFGWKFDAAVDGHFTETDLDNYDGSWDYEIDNEGTVDSFKQHARLLCERLKERHLLPVAGRH